MRDRLVGHVILLVVGIFFASFAVTFFILLIADLATHKVAAPLTCVATDGMRDEIEMEEETPTLFIYSFNAPGVLQEASHLFKSSSPYWFLDSGGRLVINNNIGMTIRGALVPSDRWYRAYARSNSLDTDGGAHPQNIFRLVSKHTWENVSEEVWLRITADNFSVSPNRNQSNGLFLMSRYCDSDNLYYAGIRVDGTAVIKKKYAGIYYTMVQAPFFAGAYSARTNPNLLPHGVWLGLRTVTETSADGAVSVRLYVKQTEESAWTLAAAAEDRGQWGGTPPITTQGAVGIRTDFMDVEFKNIRVEAL